MTIRSLAITLPLVIAGWVTTLMTTGLLSDEAPAQLVLFPSAQLINSLPPETSIVDHGAWSITVTSKQSGFAKLLFERGAFFVLPSGLSGCFDIQLAKKARSETS